MQSYKAPLRDMEFLLKEVHSVSDLSATEAYQSIDDEEALAILAEAARIHEDVLAPLNAIGDREGCHYKEGEVTTPTGFRSAYKQFTEAGWGAINATTAYGGQGLSHVIGKLIEEMTCSCNVAFSLYPGLSHGAFTAIEQFASEELKNLYLPRLVAGDWSGTMCLTEDHCGTDLGLLRTRAEPLDDGTFAISGAKIFISAGEHDLTDNIIHLVLARLPDAPVGVAGISLFLVPKWLPSADGARGAGACQ